MHNHVYSSNKLIDKTIKLCIVTFFAIVSSTLFAQDNGFKMSGVVQSVEGERLVGVSVQVEGTTRGTMTNINGDFSLRLNDKENVVFSYLGFKSQTIKGSRENGIVVILEEESKLMDEVVVVGYGHQKKESVTGAISSISTTELIQSPVANVSNALAGRIPGLTSIQPSGEPGRNQSILKVRGIGTLNTGDESNPLILVDGVERNTIDDLNPHDIETLNVLKDASATAVFGVRGANGVIIITTKTGQQGKPRVNLTTNYGVQNPINLPRLLNSYDYAVLKDEALINDGSTPIFTEHYDLFRSGADPIFHSSRNWFDEFIKKTAQQQQYNINVSGGNPLMKYFVSFGYMDQEGIYDAGKLDVGYNSNPKYKRYNLRTNFDFNLNKNLDLYFKFGTSIFNSNYPNTSSTDFFTNILSTPPFSPGIINGKVITGFINDPLGAYSIERRAASPYSYLLNSGYMESFGNKLNLNIGFNYKMDFITKGLSFRGMIAYDNNYSYSSQWAKSVDLYSVALMDPNDLTDVSFIQTSYDGNFSFTDTKIKWRKIYSEAALNYNRKFNDHSITSLVLFNISKEHDPIFEYNLPKALLGIVGRVTYNYKLRYLAEFNLGYNGSEQFPQGNRFGFFPAYSVGWVITEEPFFPKNDVFTFAKIRGSYGEVGNDKTGGDRFLYLPSVYTYEYAANHGYWLGTTGVDLNWYYGALEGQIGNPNVTWERAKKTDIGIELRMFKNRFSLSADVFKELRDNILWTRGTVSDYVAAKLPKVNLGVVENKGFELDMGWNSNEGDFNYWLKGNMAFAKNKVIYKDEPNMPYYWMNDTGFSVGQFRGYRTDGLFNYIEETSNRPYYNFYGNKVQRGDLKFIDINGDGLVNQNDIVPTGYSQALPEITYGFSLGFNYKGFDTSLLFQGVENSSLLLRLMSGWAFNYNWGATYEEFKERWNEERFLNGEIITKPRLSAQGQESPNAQTSDFLIHSADYLRLKNIEIGYKVPAKFTQKLGISSFRIYISGNNLLTFTTLKNVDPESRASNGAYYPLTRVFNVGTNINF